MGDSTTVNVKWDDGYTFIASNAEGYSVILDSPVKEGDRPRSVSPSQALLCALGGCTGIDIVSLMKKMRQDLKELRVEVKGEKTDGYPIYFKHIHVKYHVTGRKIDKASLERAITLSHEKYCTVTQTVNGKAKVEWSYEITESG
jgi:putative redox protein